MRRLLLVFAFACSAFTASESYADIVFAYTAEVNPAAPVAGVFLTEPDAPNAGGDVRVDVAIGDVTRVNVFIIETGANESRLSDSGLLTAGLVADFNTGLGEVTTIIGQNLPLDPNAGNAPLFRFNQGPAPSFDNTAGTLQMQGGINLNDARDDPGFGTGTAFVGFFEFEAQAEGSTTFTLSDPNATATVANNVLNDTPNFTDIDAELFAAAPSLTITVATAIPEPSAFFALSAIAGACTLRRRRRS
ncbi:MAG: PEP-CTERM sorting domain-containing protein [Planctomycetota bacterium]